MPGCLPKGPEKGYFLRKSQLLVALILGWNKFPKECRKCDGMTLNFQLLSLYRTDPDTIIKISHSLFLSNG